jgi:uncharacterized protein YndB with AHSA1/START domain
MGTKPKEEKQGGIGNAAVRVRTGKTWNEWFKMLDAAGARDLTHREIVALVGRDDSVNRWWQQMVTVTYEQGRGLRARHQRSDGFEVSKSKTVSAPVGRVYRAWTERAMRQRWLPNVELRVRATRPNKALRFTWVDGRTVVAVSFDAAGGRKSRLTVQHGKLPSEATADRMQRFWGGALERLAESLA